MNPLQRRRLLGCAAAAALLPAAWPAFAAEPWPSRPIKWVLPYLAGTGPDITARILAEAVSPLLGQPVVIENRAGAGGNIGARLVAKSPPDGYTWIYSAAPMAANMRMYKVPGYDALKDFRHVMRLTTSDIVLIVNPDSGIRSLDDLVARARANPGKLNYASGGVGTPSHLGVELLLNAVDAQATHVPYKGASELVNAVLGNQVSFGTPIFSVAFTQIQAGKLKALAVAGSARNPLLPEVPTLAELGVRGVDLTSWGGVSVPAGTPDAIVARIRSAFESALKQPAVAAALVERGGQVSPQGPEAYARGFSQEIALTEAMMKRAGLEPQ
ncbi:Bug family tripartite tricarboxylate transporter substrate binding protein [Variovorax ginsengisoli]|uniref:Tripartite tricarboxylate transporter substrate binding protein n=1 Tax=Variovorax ginsengisoli TaxID=363844 RepID=A0ABT8RY84_9BURK|nr:tripartite tricarboxylate transporter substrate binding protein [Variovorax ginsengisoli]MDN8612303.1 tripartite tricarboxylate transporter substrate binding protein [Variovorax ginsengisoli]MDO1531473.1 tripartite tricarboxylate transporter substrate binding protein [Variovorax ginsengisoli]